MHQDSDPQHIAQTGQPMSSVQPKQTRSSLVESDLSWSCFSLLLQQYQTEAKTHLKQAERKDRRQYIKT